MIKLDKDYSDYTDTTDLAYPAGKAVDATTEESIDGTPYLKTWMNNIHGAFTALWVKAFGSVDEMSGTPDSVDHSDVLLAVEKLIETPLTAEAEARVAADTTEAEARASADIAQLQQVIAEVNARISAITAEAEARTNADNTLQHNINLVNNAQAGADTTEATARTNADNALSGRIASNDTDIHNLAVEIDRLQQYRSWETNTGKTWIDGQVIYRRCAYGYSSVHGATLFDIGTTSFVIKNTANILYRGNGEWCENYHNGSEWGISFAKVSGSVKLECTGNFEHSRYVVIVEYIK